MASLKMYPFPDDEDDGSFIPPHFVPESEEVQAEGIDYIQNSSCDCDDDKSIIPSLFNHADHATSLIQLPVNLNESRSVSRPEHKDSTNKPGKAPKTASKNSNEVSIWLPRTWSKFLTGSLPPEYPASKESDDLRACYSDDEANSDVSRRCLHNKKVLLKKMRHRYNECSLPGPGKLMKCTCTSCWAENLLAISRGSVIPMHPNYCASRVAEKCEKNRSMNRVRFGNKQKTLTYDVLNGNVFDFEEGPPDLSGAPKEIGLMARHDLQDSDEESDEYNSSDDDEKHVGS